jgi:glutathione peroxidase
MNKVKLFSILFVAVMLLSAMAANNKNGGNMNNSVSDVVVKDMDGKDVNLADYKGKVLLIVNVASKCGYTPQYEALESIYKKYKDQGFEILAFPCNDFGGQEPGTNDEIKTFCTTKYDVTFKLFNKIKVLGDERSPLYQRLINNDVTEKGDVKWNFEKFLIDKDGNIVARFRSKIKPDSDDVLSAIGKELAVAKSGTN